MTETPASPLSHRLTPRRLLRASIVVALLTILLKTLAWWITGSVSLLSDALEAFVNLAGAMFALAMVTVAQQPPDAGHPYGHHKAEYFSSGFEGILIVGASVAILGAAALRFLHPQPLDALGWGLALTVVSTGLNAVLAWVMLRAARVHRSVALQGDARHLLTDVWTSVGVFIGLLAAGATGWLWLDPLLAAAVALNILREGVRLIWEASQGLMDEALAAPELARVHAALERQRGECAGVVYFDSLTSRRAGARSFLELHMHVPASWTLGRAATARARVEAALMDAVPGLVATIELLPTGAVTVFEQAEARAEAQGQAGAAGPAP